MFKPSLIETQKEKRLLKISKDTLSELETFTA